MDTINYAANAYRTARSLGNESAVPGPGAPEQDTQSFGSLVSAAVSDMSQTGAMSETKTLDHLAGNATIVDVVTAVAETEIAMESLVAVRDRVIAAYQEVMRMPI